MMSKELQTKIRTAWAHQPQIMSGKVVSVDMAAQTMEVRTSLFEDTDTETITTTLNAVSENGNGIIIYPAVGSDVVIGTVDGPGEYTLIRASNITKAVITIGTQVFTMDGSKYSMVNGSDSLATMMQDLMTALAAMTFTNGAGTTSIANNVTDLNNVKTRFNSFFN